MAIQISGCTVIDNDRNITNANNMCVGVVTMTGSSGDIETPGTITVGGLDFPPIPISFSPGIGSTNNSIISNIVITFDQALEKGTGNITLRDGSASGTVLQTIAVTSGSVTISGAVVTIVPPSSLPTSTDVFVVVDAGAFTNVNIDNPSPLIDTYNFTTSIAPALGSSFGGGFVICNSGSFSWIVAPSSSQVARNWYSRDDANTTAQQVSGCTGWFVPSCGQLLNPGYTCRDFWDSFSCAFYWSSSELTPGSAWAVNVATGGIDVGPNTINFKSQTKSVRAFRTVTY